LSRASPRELPFSGSDLLLEEMSHRMNNELTSAIAAVSRAAARSKNEEVRATLSAVSDRLLAFAFVHRVLQMPSQSSEIDASVYLRQLCEAISRSKLADKGIGLALVEGSVRLEAVRCWRLGLIVSELIANAARHAFDAAGGAIRVELLTSDAFVECRVSDSGRAAGPVRPGRGLRIVEALAGTLGGTIDYVFGEHGSAVVLVFPRHVNSGDDDRRATDIRAATLSGQGCEAAPA